MRVPMSCRSIDERVDVAQHLGRRLARVAVEREQRHAPRGRRVSNSRVRRLDHVVLHVRSKAVLRAEERRDVDVAIRERQIDDVVEPVIDGRGIADDADALAAQPAGVEETRSSQA